MTEIFQSSKLESSCRDAFRLIFHISFCVTIVLNVDQLLVKWMKGSNKQTAVGWVMWRIWSFVLYNLLVGVQSLGSGHSWHWRWDCRGGHGACRYDLLVIGCYFLTSVVDSWIVSGCLYYPVIPMGPMEPDMITCGTGLIWKVVSGLYDQAASTETRRMKFCQDRKGTRLKK